MTTTGLDTMFEDWATAWSVHDVDMLLSLFTDDGVHEDVPRGIVSRGKAEVKAFAEAVFAAFPDFKVELTSGFTAGNWAGAEWTISGTNLGDFGSQPATGKSFSIRGSSIFELRSGKIRRNSEYYERATS